MTNFEEAKRTYQSMEIPEQLPNVVDQAFAKAAVRRHVAWYKPALSVAVEHQPHFCTCDGRGAGIGERGEGFDVPRIRN